MVTHLTEQTLTLVGWWNRMNFTPAWVGEKLFHESKQGKANVPIMPVDPLIYFDKRMKFYIHPDRECPGTSAPGRKRFLF